ncbi:MAG: transporter [Gammaproteobacteria bacterium (ex Lamellibrachia satsuma)]|nr:MAG: pimeloyl-ACP methyl ester esterase BioH [Gammaproteobacteria bacterium (ex Lamellibrachia satsuma)]RRS32417.1 MAG: transporter [Gammaproteobacteria bacterium (ex Lamellibrachia satsuma)]RRS34512.1 MAG: transporter [Gammaproteobacteria bacterium (ex Lamellibrachia satsuma)]
MSLNLETLGRGGSLVLLHGWGMNSAVWGGFAERLAENRRVILIDLPGHGGSPFTEKRSLREWADACLAVAPERAVWIGWSLGAQVALQVALDQPERVQKLISLAGTPRFVQGESWPHAMADKTFGQFATSLKQDHRKTLERFLALQVRGSDEARATLRALKIRLMEKPDPQPTALETGLSLLKNVDLREDLAALQMPTLWLYGERDTLVPAAAADLLPAILPQAEVHRISGAAHAPFLSHQDETLALIETFLESSREQ